MPSPFCSGRPTRRVVGHEAPRCAAAAPVVSGPGTQPVHRAGPRRHARRCLAPARHRRLVGVAAACGEALDGADRHALVGDAALLAPGGEVGEEAAVQMGGVGAGVGAHLLEGDARKAAGKRCQLTEPAAEAQVAHAAALEAARAEGDDAGGDATVLAAQRPAGGGPEVEGEDGGTSESDRQRCREGRAACAGRGHGESREIHGGLREGMIVVRAAAARFLAELAVAARLRGPVVGPGGPVARWAARERGRVPPVPLRPTAASEVGRNNARKFRWLRGPVPPVPLPDGPPKPV